MKRVFKLTLNEIKHLKWTVLVTALALILFTASLFSVIFVYNDLSDNVFNYFDGEDEPLSFYAKNASASEIISDVQCGLFEGEKEELTYNAVLTAANGNSLSTEIEEVDEDGVTYFEHISSRAICVTERYLDTYGKAFDLIPLPQKTGEIMLEKEYAEQLQVSAGDVVSIGDKQFTVCGTYDDELYGDFDLAYGFVVSVDENTVFESVNVSLDKSKDMYQAYRTLKKNNVDVELSGYTQSMLDNLSLVNGFLIAIALTIAVVNLLILYAVFAVILRNRQAYICRLKIVGASNLLVFAVYFTIIVVLLIAICVAGFFLSKLIVANIMDACSQAFESAFTTNVSFGIVGVYFAVITVLLGLLCYLSACRIDGKTIVSVTRSD